jgi:hypothetical protein
MDVCKERSDAENLAEYNRLLDIGDEDKSMKAQWFKLAKSK